MLMRRQNTLLAIAVFTLPVALSCSSTNSPAAAGGSSSTGGSFASGGSSGTTGGGSATGGGNAGGNVGTLFGNIAVKLFSDPDENYSTVIGKIFDGPQPAPNPLIGPLKVSQEEAGCQLLVPKGASCEPGCGTTGVCTENNHCTPKPNAVSVGTLRVQGLGDELTLTPISLGYSGPTLPYPACTEGADVKLQADTFAITGKCIAGLKLSGPDPIPVKTGQPAAFSWVPPTKSGISRIQIILEIAHHGGYKGEIDCDVPDTGSFQIPATLITALVNLGLAGYPTVALTRVSTAADAKEPNVKLLVSSSLERAVDTGVISCGIGDTMCPTGTTCDDATKTCK
jgi:hypothetical protein